MKPETRRYKCLHCKKLFVPDYRNRERQGYCATPECRKAGKRARQQRWLSKPENSDYFRDAQNVERVQDWRKEHPGYWKRHPRKTAGTLQDACSAQPIAVKEVAPLALQGGCAGTVTRRLPGASASTGGAYLQVHRLYVTRRHRHLRPPSDSQWPGHSGSTLQKTCERKHCL